MVRAGPLQLLVVVIVLSAKTNAFNASVPTDREEWHFITTEHTQFYRTPVTRNTRAFASNFFMETKKKNTRECNIPGNGGP